MLTGIGLMIASVFAIALGSVFAKLLLADLSATQVLWLRFVGFFVVVGPIALALHGRNVLRPHSPGRQAVRGVIGLACEFSLLLPIDAIGVSQAIAAFYVFPAISYGLGILRLGEPSSWGKWAAVGVGFVGVAIAIDPDIENVEIGVVCAIAAAFLASVRVVMYREDGGVTPPLIAATWDRGVGAGLATLAVGFAWEPIEPEMAAAIAGLVLSSVDAQLLFIHAIRRSPIGVLAPFTFWEVAFAIGLDFYILDAELTSNLAVGATIIVAAGLLLTAKRSR